MTIIYMDSVELEKLIPKDLAALYEFGTAIFIPEQLLVLITTKLARHTAPSIK
jgi:hypothetical protein